MIILRQENFGGIAFNQTNAHQLWLDNELFNSLKNGEKSVKVNQVYRELDVKYPEFYLISVEPQENNYPFAILSGPALADINITSRCNLNCPHCYVDSGQQGTDMTLADFNWL